MAACLPPLLQQIRILRSTAKNTMTVKSYFSSSGHVQLRNESYAIYEHKRSIHDNRNSKIFDQFSIKILLFIHLCNWWTRFICIRELIIHDSMGWFHRFFRYFLIYPSQLISYLNKHIYFYNTWITSSICSKTFPLTIFKNKYMVFLGRLAKY